jgi:lipopolysaccharide export system permease protein
MFLRIFLVCFLSFTGLFIVIHLFSNLDELGSVGEQVGWPQLMFEFYGPRVAEMFDKTAGIWALVAAVFSVSLMQRRREMTALEAAGVTKSRILRSIFVCAVVIIGLAAANREFVIPKYKDQLVRTAQNWANRDKISMGIYQDVNSGIKIRGEDLSLVDNKITDADVQIPANISRDVPRIMSLWATQESANELHPAGVLFRQVELPTSGMNLPTMFLNEQPIVFWPRDHAWLKPDQCFVACDFQAYQVAFGKKLLDYQSFPEMLVELRKPKLWFGSGQHINVHARVIQPLLDITLLLLGLPLIIARSGRNVFVSAGLCFLIVAVLQLSVVACHSLGTYSLVKPSVLAAWLPAIIFVPLSFVSLNRINR